MKKKLKYVLIIMTIIISMLTGCSSTQTSQTNSSSTSTTASKITVDKEFTSRDLDVGYEDSTATHITLSENTINVSGSGAKANGSVLTISKEGTYVISGTLKNGQIVVDAGDNDKVQIVLNGASVTCLDNAPIYVKNADKVFVTLKTDTVNTLTDGTEYKQTDDNDVDAVIFSKADLTINGSGTLNVNGNYKHGIASKDDLVITGGTLNITAVKDALNGKDCVKIKDGTFNLSAAGGNGIQSKNADDETKGYVYVCGGTINVVKSSEGIEGTVILVENGTINITAEDDGFNAASGKSDTTQTSSSGTDTKDQGPQAGDDPFSVDTNCSISIKGGTISIDASGDGIDSNGSLYISGGKIYVSGPVNDGNGALDYNGAAEITGGEIIAAGSSGMAQGFSDSSSQYSLLNNFDTACEAGTEIKLTDKDGNVLASYTPKKQYQSVVISTPKLAKGSTYTLTAGSQTASITLSSVSTSNGKQGMNGQPGQPGQHGQGRGEKPETGTQTQNNN